MNDVILLVDYGLPSCVRDRDDQCVSSRKQFEAPEMWISSKRPTNKGDVYAMGMTFYEVSMSRIYISDYSVDN